ncbi:MAG: hypothetical protein IJ735_03760 [Clostridia bacterium]|nr:hypothetical protein [Clostridia bacterium]
MSNFSSKIKNRYLNTINWEKELAETFASYVKDGNFPTHFPIDSTDIAIFKYSCGEATIEDWEKEFCKWFYAFWKDSVYISPNTKATFDNMPLDPRYTHYFSTWANNFADFLIRYSKAPSVRPAGMPDYPAYCLYNSQQSMNFWAGSYADWFVSALQLVANRYSLKDRAYPYPNGQNPTMGPWLNRFSEWLVKKRQYVHDIERGVKATDPGDAPLLDELYFSVFSWQQKLVAYIQANIKDPNSDEAKAMPPLYEKIFSVSTYSSTYETHFGNAYLIGVLQVEYKDGVTAYFPLSVAPLSMVSGLPLVTTKGYRFVTADNIDPDNEFVFFWKNVGQEPAYSSAYYRFEYGTNGLGDKIIYLDETYFDKTTGKLDLSFGKNNVQRFRPCLITNPALFSACFAIK